MKSKLKIHTNIKRGGLVACALIGLLLWASVGWGTTYYVDAVNGDDGDTGADADHAWQTLSRVYTWYTGEGTKVVEGDTVIFADGNYGTFREHTNDNPWETYFVERSDWVTYRAATGASPQLTKIDIKNQNHGTMESGQSRLVFDGFIITERVNITYTNYIQVKNCTITDTSYDDNSGHPVNIISANYITIQGCDISHGGNGIYFGGDNCSFIDNDIHGIAADGIHGAGSNLLVQGNVIYDIDKVYAKEDDPEDWEGYHGDGMHFESNVLRTNITISSNIVRNCNNVQGISIYGNPGETAWNSIQFENNLIYNLNTSSAYTIIVGVDSANVVNNTVIGSMRAHTHSSYGSCVVTNFYNNIVSSLLIDNDVGSYTAQIQNHGNNIFENDPDGDGGTYKFYTNGTESIAALNTLLQTFGNHEYYPDDDSIAIDAGDSDNSPATDIRGNQRDDEPDIGCYEYGITFIIFFTRILCKSLLFG